MRVALLTLFYKSRRLWLNIFFEISKSFEGKFCFINSLISKNSLDVLKSNNTVILGYGSNIGLSKAYNFILNESILKKFGFCFISDKDSRME